MNDSEIQLEEIELSIDQAKQLIENKKALLRLTENPDFKLLIREGYFEKEASRLVLLKADFELQSEQNQKAIMKQIDAIGSFRQYLNTIMQLGIQAERDLASDQETREELLAEA